MPSEGPYALPFEGPQVDRPVARATDDGILVDGEGVYPTPMPSEGPDASSLEGP